MKMKHLNKVAAVVLILIGSASAKAQSTATATATATIVTPITITQVTDMNFGNIAVDASFGGSVILAPDNSRTASGNVSLPSSTGTVSAAEFLVTGNSGFTYAISLPADITLVHSGGLEVMTANDLTSTPSGTGTLSGAGNETINVGATLLVVGGQQAGVYTGTFDVTVNYN